MVILKRLFSETGLFNPVSFHEGINVIRGEYTRSPEERTELNGIGKSTLVRLIDFALLSDWRTAKRYFDPRKYKFLEGHTVSLEIAVGHDNYIIKRSFDEPTSPKYGKRSALMETYQDAELRSILGNIFFGKDEYKGVFESTWFRSLIRFFVKDDIDHFERKDPLKFPSEHINKFEAYKYNLFLLGLPNKSITYFDELKKKKDDLKNQTKRISSRLQEETGKGIAQINSEITLLDQKIKSLEESLGDYRFLESYKNVEEELIELSSEIRTALKRLTLLKRKLAEYQKSYDFDIEVDKNRIAGIYAEIKNVFGDAVKETLDGVYAFRKRLSESRAKFLKEKENSLNDEIENIMSSISTMEDRRSKHYKILDERKALDSIKNSYSMIIEEKAKREKLIVTVNQLNSLDEEINAVNMKITNTVSEIRKEINNVSGIITKIQSIFFDLLRSIVDVTDIKEAVFDIRPVSNLNSPFSITIDVPKSEALGKARLRILAHDLTVFFNIVQSQRRLPYFLIHDGVFHSIGKKTVISLLNYVYSKYEKLPNIQYIITANEDEIDIPSDRKHLIGDYNFNMSENVIATYKDIPEEMIFRREY